MLRLRLTLPVLAIVLALTPRDGLAGPLHKAADSGVLSAVVEALIAAGADPNAEAKGGYTPLHSATGRGKDASPAVVEALLAAFADPNARDEDAWTPLHYATGKDANPAVVKALIEAGADPNARNKHGDTPLHRAAYFNPCNLAVVKALIEAGADPNARANKGDYIERSHPPVIVLAMRPRRRRQGPGLWTSRPEFALRDNALRRMEVRNRGRLAGRNSGREWPGTAIVTFRYNPPNKGGYTPFHSATHKDASSAVVEALIAAGADCP